MTAILLALCGVAAAYLAWRVLRSIPWAATLRLLGLFAAVLALVLLAAHHNIDPYALLGHIAPDFGGNP